MSEFKTHAVMALTNCGGVAIQINESGDSVRYKWYDQKPSRWVKIYYRADGEPYFKISGRRYFLSDFMRVNY